MGTARDLVVGSTSWPACSWSVSKCLESPAMLGEGQLGLVGSVGTRREASGRGQAGGEEERMLSSWTTMIPDAALGGTCPTLYTASDAGEVPGQAGKSFQSFHHPCCHALMQLLDTSSSPAWRRADHPSPIAPRPVGEVGGRQSTPSRPSLGRCEYRQPGPKGSGVTADSAIPCPVRRMPSLPPVFRGSSRAASMAVYGLHGGASLVSPHSLERSIFGTSRPGPRTL